MTEIIYKAESYAILGACFEVYRDKGAGFNEAVYQECLEIEFAQRDIPAVPKPKLEIEYRGRKLKHLYEPDFVRFGAIVVELKAVEQLTDVFRAQLLNYLKATQMRFGLLINFGHYPGLEHERMANTCNLHHGAH